MKTKLQFRFSFIFFIVLFIAAVSITAVAQQQIPADWIRQYDGIPIIASLDYDWAHPNHIADIDSMKGAGIDAVILSIASGTKVDSLGNWNSGGFRVIPVKSINSNLDTLNWITYYTDAKYTVWETEDITPADTSYILHDTNIMEEVSQGNDKFIRLIGSAAGSVNELIRGPYYCQNVYEQNIQGILDTAFYTADFRMKLELNNGYSDNIHPDTPLCIIQVTQSKLAVPNTWTLDCTYPINSIVITRRNFQLLNQFQNFSFAYNLGSDSCSQATSSPRQYYPPGYSFKSSGLSDIQKFLLMRDYIEFKVKWLGKPNYLLSIDKITVYDQKGFEIMDPTSDARSRIELQANSLNTYNNNITGWLGIDEPNSIDKYAPVKKVNEILNDNSNSARPLWLSIMGKWDGVWENSDNPFGTYHLSPWKEKKKRIGNINIWQDVYYLDYPWNSSVCTNCTEPWKSENIKIAAELNYKQAYDLDNYYGVSIQCGEIHIDGIAEQRNINESELLYETNLALMYGTKFLSLYTYFAQRDTDDTNPTGTKHGIVDSKSGNLIYTNKYRMLRGTLSPRLKGLMGKTLKKLTPTDQILKTPLNTQFSLSNFIDKVIKGNCTAQGSQSGDYNYDLGFFTDSLDGDYFMMVSRWYNGECDPALTIKLKPEYYNNFNIKIVDYINEQTYNTNRFGSISTAPSRGDACFFGVFPILQFGGSISLNDTTYDGEILFDELTIESGATLTVNGTYNANANITVKSGGKIVAGQNAMINFGSGKKLIVEGIVEIKGTSENNNLSIVAGAEQAVLVKSGSAFTLNYCTILAPHTGIETETGIQSYVNISNTQITATRTGISLIGGSQENRTSSTPPSMIYKCNITTSLFYGISVANFTSILVKENTLVSCGMSISNVAAAFIQSNNISLGTNLYQPGIFFNNSGGYIRNNTIKNRVNGIHLGNSSPDIGGNLIEYNYLHGIYNSSGSFPNLIGLIQTSPPTYFPLAGYNTIKNNGNDTSTGGSNDGSEIYFNYSDAHLGTERNPGCNQISDDRTATSSMTTIWLLNGYYANEPHFLDAIYNYWGTTTPTGSRFGIATNFTPYTNSLCAISGGGAEEKILLKTSSGIVVDTIYSAEGVPENQTTLEIIYSEADNLFATGNLTQSKPIYEQIVNANYTTEEKLPAYNKLYTIANLNGADETYFNSLQSIFNDIANTETDTLLKKIYNQNAIKCDLSKQEYLTAINKFDNIIQQKPNSEEAVYAEIDIITTALNLDTTNSQLGKMGGGKYLVKGTSDYLSKLNDILQSKFGINSEEKEQIIPKEYSLYQNYPNPFNPTTTIKFDLPKDGFITLEIYDILGRRITTLINENRSAGSYEQVFNASSLASGVYVYKLQAGDYINSKKMLLLK